MKHDQIIKNLESRKKFNTLYQFDPVKTSDARVVEQWLCERDHLCLFKNGIDQITRKSSYCVKHDTSSRKTSSCREEERIAIFLAENHLSLGSLGEVLDYQVPLKDTNLNKGVGKIDLISYNDKTNRLYLLELKKPSSSESLLRCCLESYTYSRIINGAKLIQDISKVSWINKKINNDATIVPCVLIFPGSRPANEFLKPSKEIQTIISSLNVSIAIISYTAKILHEELK